MKLTNEQRNIIIGIRNEHHEASDGDLCVCDEVSYDIEQLLGWKMVEGDCDHDPGLFYHCWNLLPDGSILDATADQFQGFNWRNAIQIISKNHEFYEFYHPRKRGETFRCSHLSERMKRN